MSIKKKPKYIFILGSVMSGLGKGIVTVSIGKALQVRGYSVEVVKIDPYLNLDAGMMNPFEHGECYVSEDGGELDVDFGHYERFLGIEVTKGNNITTGQIYNSVIKNEREGGYFGKTVRVVPHITDEIKARIMKVEKKNDTDLVLIELGGTIGDIESYPFLEALRQLRTSHSNIDCCTVFLTYIPYPDHIEEYKTKPAQHSVQALRACGIFPDAIICRSKTDIGEHIRDKISQFTDVQQTAIFSLPNLPNVLEVPQYLDKKGLVSFICEFFKLRAGKPDWTTMGKIKSSSDLREKILIGIPGKYTTVRDSYLSIHEALVHAGWELNAKVVVELINTESLERENAIEQLIKFDGILIPGGFGTRGTEGKINAIKYARENKVPFLGICFGFQIAIIEYARNILGKRDANSTEMNRTTSFPIININLPIKTNGGIEETMRLGANTIRLKVGSRLSELYGKDEIIERHRHRYKVNMELCNNFEGSDLEFSGSCDSTFEAFELLGHPFYFGTQFHPEFKSNPWEPSPLFIGFIEACLKKQKERLHKKKVAITA